MNEKKKNRTFRVEVSETSSRVIDVEADSVDAAVAQVKKQYDNEGIVLDHNDCQDYEIKCID